MKHRPQLDGLRALAIAGVLHSHFFDDASPAAPLGVLLFFVLSGYLITMLLLEARDTGGVSLLNFYARRALRLCPAFYCALGVATAFDIENIRAVFWWHAAYASNILFALRQDYVPWIAAPWWSLAVEEQFYLLWALAVVLATRRALPWICLAAILVSLVFSAAVQASGGAEQLNLLLPGPLDGLAGGALLACARRYRPHTLRRLPAVGIAAALTVVPLLALGSWSMVLARLLAVAAACALVDAASRDSTWRFGRVLSSPPVTFIGRISYGMYVYHMLVFWALIHFSGAHPATQRGWSLLLAGSALTVALATLSWFALERPFNRLKLRFPMAPPLGSAQAAAPRPPG
jgi:peptidoglycan/LPS O-acetylase OafA/YrhL